MAKLKEYACGSCDAVFKIKHEETSDVTYCPFCAEELIDDNIYSSDYEDDEYN